MAEEGPCGFELDLRPRGNLAIELKLSPELRQALGEAHQAGRTASLRFGHDTRGQVG